MGGVGSGSRRRSSRPTTTSAIAVDVAALRRAGLLSADTSGRSLEVRGHTPGGLWPSDREAVCLVTVAHIGPRSGALTAKIDGDTTRPTRAALEAQPQPLGGVRWWARCPACDTRRRVLYLMPTLGGRRWRLRCRACAGFDYPTQRLSAADRWQRRAEAIVARLGGVQADGRVYPPHGMRRATFDRLMDDVERLELAAFEYHTRRMVNRLSARRR